VKEVDSGDLPEIRLFIMMMMNIKVYMYLFHEIILASKRRNINEKHNKEKRLIAIL